MTKICLAGLVSAVSVSAGVQLTDAEGTPIIAMGDSPLLELSTPWVATGAWQGVYRFPADLPPVAEPEGDEGVTARRHEGPHGVVTQRTTVADDSVTVRYEFAFRDVPQAETIQWVLRLEPERFDGAIVRGRGTEEVALRPLAGVGIDALQDCRILLADSTLDITVRAADGTWKLSDARQAAWAKCYRLEYNRPFSRNGSRNGWFEVTFAGSRTAGLALPLTTGPDESARGLTFRTGPPATDINATVAAIIFRHTAHATGAPGTEAGRVSIRYVDGRRDAVPLRWEDAVTAADDDPRDLPNGRLAPLEDGTPTWLSVWRNPTPEAPVAGIEAETKSAGWRLLAATGLRTDADDDRITAALAGLRAQRPLPEQVTVSLDGTWEFRAEGSNDWREVAVPSRWESLEGGHGIHTATYRRTVDIPASMTGQRIIVRCEAIGEYGELRVNGRTAGTALAGPLPVEFDITGLVTAPSTGNALEIRVLDDTHFSVPKTGESWRNRRHWVPHGIGGNNRKGLFQSVSLCGRPPVRIDSVRVQTSFREKTLTVVYEIVNPGREAQRVYLGGSVRPHGGGEVELTLPETEADLPGQVTTTVSVTAPWANPRLWQPNQPHLYDLRSILRDGNGDRLQRRDTRFGFREVWFDGIHFYLNGIRCNLRGESPSYAQHAGPLETRAGTEDLVRKCLATNFNVLRFHAAPAPPHVYDVCDELGMMVIDESAIYASWGMIMPEHPDWVPNCQDHLRRWVRRDRNHPSIVLWSAENEGLNVRQLSPAQLRVFRTVIDEHDGTRPVIFDGDGTGEGASPASVKHYVKTIADLEHRGGKSSGYGRDLRHDIYWAAAYKQPIPLGIGEFLFPANDAMREKKAEVCAMMGLQTRGYRYADWFDIRPYNPHYTGAFTADGLDPKLAHAWGPIVKSFAAVAVFDKAYDELGPFPDPPELRRGRQITRTLVVYNDTFEDETVVVTWAIRTGGKTLDGGKRTLRIPLGYHTEFDIAFTAPDRVGELGLYLETEKAGTLRFHDTRQFLIVE